jgi:hypothetical protein
MVFAMQLTRDHEMKDPTLRKIRRAGNTPIRYQTANRRSIYGWIIEEGQRGTLKVHLIGPEGGRTRWLSKKETSYITELTPEHFTSIKKLALELEDARETKLAKLRPTPPDA